MGTFQSFSPSEVAFMKYPELPEDIRLMVIDEFIQTAREEHASDDHQWSRKPYDDHRPPFLSHFSSINDEWNRVVETLLFRSVCITSRDLSDFAEICGKRHGRLNRITFMITMDELPVGVLDEEYTGIAVAQLFNIMKDWSHADRERHGLIEVQLELLHPVPCQWSDLNICSHIGTLPEVPIIGALYEGPRARVLHPLSTLRLYQSMTNVHHASLSFPIQNTVSNSMEQASSAIRSLGLTQPNLKYLELMAGRHGIMDVLMPGKELIATFPPCWHNGLVELNLKQVGNPPGLLAEASNVAWPNLKKLSLSGELDDQVKTEDEIRAAARQTCTDLVQGLVSMLPGMPAITTVWFDMRVTEYAMYSVPFQLQMCLGNPDRGVEAGCEPPSYRFVPNHDNGVVVASGTNFSGYLATDLQHTVRYHQFKDLGVFFLNNERTTWGDGRICGQWNPETGRWEATFTEEADEFIYQMGQYLEWTQH